MYNSIEDFMGHIEAKNHGEKEFHQAVHEVVESLWDFLQDHPDYVHARILERITAGNGKESDLKLLVDVANRIEGNTICAFGDASAWPVQSFIQHYYDEFEYMVKHEGKTKAA